MEMAMNSVSASGFCWERFVSPGRFTGIVCSCWISGVAIMKMISSVKPRSTRLVTLSSATGWSWLLRRKLRAMGLVQFGFEFDAIRQAAGVVLHFGNHFLHAADEEIVPED